MFFFCAQCLLKLGSEVHLKRIGVRLCSWESLLNLRQTFFFSGEDRGVDKKYIRQTLCSAMIFVFDASERKSFFLEILFFSEAVTWQFWIGVGKKKQQRSCSIFFFSYEVVLSGAQTDKAYCGAGFLSPSKFSQHSNSFFSYLFENKQKNKALLFG